MYKVEPEAKGCEKCGSGGTFIIVDPNGVGGSTVYRDRGEAEELAEELNAAFLLGKQIDAKGVYLELFHGRSDPKQEMSDWGEQGPILGPFKFVHTTYKCDLKFETLDGESGDLGVNDDLVYYDGMWYGDWSVFAVGDGLDVGDRLKKFEQDKANQPAKLLRPLVN